MERTQKSSCRGGKNTVVDTHPEHDVQRAVPQKRRRSIETHAPSGGLKLIAGGSAQRVHDG